MSIEHLYTLQTGQAAVNGPQSGNATKGNQSGVLSLQGLSFLDFILSQAQQSQSGKNASGTSVKKDGDPGLLQSKNPFLSKQAGTDLATLLADNPEIKEQLEKFTKSTPYSLEDTLAMNQQAFDNMLVTLPDGSLTIDEEALEAFKNKLEKQTRAPEIFDLFFSQKKGVSDDRLIEINELKSFLRRINKEKDPALLLANMTAEQITDLKEYIKELQQLSENKEISEEKQDDILAFFEAVGILPAPEKAHEFSAGLAAPLQAAAPEGQKISSSKDTLHDEYKKPASASRLSEQGFLNTDEAFMDRESDRAERFAKLLKSFEQTQVNENGPVKNIDLKNSALTQRTVSEPNPAQNNFSLSNFRTFETWNTGFLEGFTSLSGSISTGITESADILAGQSQPVSLTSLQSLTNHITQSSQAGYTHPALPTLAAKIQKAAFNGEARNIILQLDPPDLGRVEVRMSFDKDKTMRASILVEKPETHLMLQRDAHALEKALADAGIDSDGGLQFELADQGHDFSHNGGHGHHSAPGQGTADTQDTQIIETTMNWAIDPETGHIHYSILA